MKPNKEGQIVKFHSPYPDEDPEQLYVILEIHTDVEKPRALIKALNTGLTFPSTETVLVDELVIVDVSTDDLIGHRTTIRKSDNSMAEGKIIKINDHRILLDLNRSADGVESNVWLTILDDNGVEQTGALLIK